MLWSSYVLEQPLNVGAVDLPSGSSQSCAAPVNKAGLWATVRCASFPVSMADCPLWRQQEAGDRSETQTWGTSRIACL